MVEETDLDQTQAFAHSHPEKRAQELKAGSPPLLPPLCDQITSGGLFLMLCVAQWDMPPE